MMLCDTPCSQTMNDPPLYHVPRALCSRMFSDLGHCFCDLHLALGGPLVNVTDLVIFDLDSDRTRQPAAGRLVDADRCPLNLHGSPARTKAPAVPRALGGSLGPTQVRHLVASCVHSRVMSLLSCQYYFPQVARAESLSPSEGYTTCTTSNNSANVDASVGCLTVPSCSAMQDPNSHTNLVIVCR